VGRNPHQGAVSRWGRASRLLELGAPCPPRDSATQHAVCLLQIPSRRRVLGAVGREAACQRRGGVRPQDVCKTGTGTSESKAVSRCRSPWTGQDVGRWRTIRSLSCLTCVATVQSVTMRVEGGAVASAGCCSVCVRTAWWRAYAAQARRSRRAVARQVVAAVRSLGRAPGTALLSCSHVPRAQERSSESIGGEGACSEVTTKRGVSPAGMTAALSPTRHGWAQDAAP